MFRQREERVGPGFERFIPSTALEQRYGQNHTLGRFRLSATADKNPKLTSPITPEFLTLLESPVANTLPIFSVTSS